MATWPSDASPTKAVIHIQTAVEGDPQEDAGEAGRMRHPEDSHSQISIGERDKPISEAVDINETMKSVNFKRMETEGEPGTAEPLELKHTSLPEIKANEVGETSNRRIRGKGGEDQLQEADSFQDDTQKPDDPVSELEWMKDNPLAGVVTNALGNTSQRHVRFDEEVEEHSPKEVQADVLEFEELESFSPRQYYTEQLSAGGETTATSEKMESLKTLRDKEDDIDLGLQANDDYGDEDYGDDNPMAIMSIEGIPFPQETKGMQISAEEEFHEEVKLFWEGINEEWENRLKVLDSLRAMKDRIKINPNQCTHLIKTYLNIDVLMQDPQEYMKAPWLGMPDTLLWLQSVRTIFAELTKIMKHGEILVRDCICEDRRAALSRMAVVPKDCQWEAVTPFSLHLQEFKWILSFTGTMVASFLCVLEHMASGSTEVQNCMEMFTITLPSSYTEMESSDRESLLQSFLEYISPSGDEIQRTEHQFAQFMAWRLLGRDPNKDQSLSRNNLEYKDILGNGSYGIVSRRIWFGIEVAVKELTKSTYRHDFEREIQFVDLQHPHVVPVFDYWLDATKGTLVMELMESNLWEHIEKVPKLSILEAINVMMQIAEAFKYLKSSAVVHRDLKAGNILVSHCGCGDGQCLVAKLADFGVSKYKPDVAMFSTKNQGTRSWMAPEVWGAAGQGKYTMAADVYSFGIMCSEILMGETPFEGIPIGELREKIVNGVRPKLPENCPMVLSAYIRRCWATDPKDRPKSFFEISDFLRYCKEKLLRNDLSSKILRVNEDEARSLLTHFDLQWCLQKDGSKPRVTDAVYEDIVRLAIEEQKWMESILDPKDRQSVQLELANYMGNWKGVERHYETAVQLLKDLVKDDNTAEANWRLGYCYELGLGVVEDLEWAISLYNTALVMDSNFWSAYVELGRCYTLGCAVPKNIELATKCFQEASRCESYQISTIQSIEENIDILLRKDGATGLLVAPTKSRERAANRLLDLTITYTGRKLLEKALVGIIAKFQLTDKNKAEGEQILDAVQGDNYNKFGNQDAERGPRERSNEEKAILEEILEHMSQHERVRLKNIFGDLRAEIPSIIENLPFPVLKPEALVNEYVQLAFNPSPIKPPQYNPPLILFSIAIFLVILMSIFYPPAQYSAFSSHRHFPIPLPGAMKASFCATEMSAAWKASYCVRFLNSLIDKMDVVACT